MIYRIFFLVTIIFFSRANAITNGILVDNNDFPQVAGLTDESGHLLCTGTLISKRVIVLAGHCLDQGGIVFGNDFATALSISDWSGSKILKAPSAVKVYFGNGRAKADGPLFGMVDVVGTKIHPGYFDQRNEDKSQFDIGYVVLKSPIENIKPIQIGSAQGVNSEVRMVGFGSTKYFKDNLYSGLKSIGFAPLSGVANGVIFVHRNVQPEPSLNKGDSGGPLFNSNNQIIGIASNFEDNGELEPTALHFRLPKGKPSWSKYAELSQHICWLRNELRAKDEVVGCRPEQIFEGDGETRDESLKAATKACFAGGYRICDLEISAPGTIKNCLRTEVPKYFGLSKKINFRCVVRGIY